MNIQSIHNAYLELEPNQKIKFLEWLEMQVILYNVFLIFIINQEKKAIKDNLHQYLVNQEQIIPPKNSDRIVDNVYMVYREEIPKIGKTYFKPILETKKNSIKNNKTKKKEKTKKTKTKSTKKRKQRGGFLFHLEEKGDQPITGNDLKKVLDLYEENLETIKYTDLGGAPTQEDLGYPLQGVILGLLLSRGKLDSSLQYHLPGGLFGFMQSVMSNPTEWSYYYQLYNSYMGELSKSKNKHDRESFKKLKMQKNPIDFPLKPI